MKTQVHGTMASAHLDLIRGLAALAVLVYHVRYRFFLDFSDVTAPGLTTRLFYASTSFGHDAVMVFFVLSGLFISSSIRRDCALGRWAWSRYTSSRLIRLYVVLIPALGLTLLWDVAGTRLAGSHPIYSGAPQPWTHDFFDVARRLQLEVLTGNLVFLQTIQVPPLGSNEPLWSLAYEFWYYLLFPCLYVGMVHARGVGRKLAVMALALVVCLTVSRTILLYFPIWLMGTAIAWAEPCRLLCRPAVFRAACLMSFLTFLALMFAGHVGAVKSLFGNSVIVMDYLTALGFSGFLYVLVHDQRGHQVSVYTTRAQQLAGMSYTLYAVHMPLLVFLRSQLITGRPWELGIVTAALGIGLAVVCFVYALIISWLTEARTPDVRRFVDALTGPKVQAMMPVAGQVPVSASDFTERTEGN